MTWDAASFALATLIVSSGALLQAVTGLGAGLIIVPLLALLSLQLVPGPMIFASMALSGTMAWRGRHDIDFNHMGVLLTGLLAGTLVAAYAVAGLPLQLLGLVFGTLILLAIAISLRAPRFSPRPASLAGVGALSGLLGAAAGIGAPVLALLYQHRAGPNLRATLAFLYLASSLLIVAVLHLAGRFGTGELQSGLYLIPGFILGYLLAPRWVHHIDRGYTRPAVLLISTLSALTLIARSITDWRT